MIQGDVCYYTFKAPDKRRPALILTRTNLIPKVNAVTVAPITTTFRDADTHVALDANDGMKEECVVDLASIQTVAKEKIGSIITHLSPERMKEVKLAIEFTLGLELI
ncbi:MAG: type II toxin-antitoxin system PemK/MazF family toxin [Pyrinomonadaceae bacterium]|nr:type II toxin-antitoxin system PemK/MazF family toxin [Pyrinomonadaceae bacterium]